MADTKLIPRPLACFPSSLISPFVPGGAEVGRGVGGRSSSPELSKTKCFCRKAVFRADRYEKSQLKLESVGTDTQLWPKHCRTERGPERGTLRLTAELGGSVPFQPKCKTRAARRLSLSHSAQPCSSGSARGSRRPSAHSPQLSFPRGDRSRHGAPRSLPAPARPRPAQPHGPAAPHSVAAVLLLRLLLLLLFLLLLLIGGRSSPPPGRHGGGSALWPGAALAAPSGGAEPAASPPPRCPGAPAAGPALPSVAGRSGAGAARPRGTCAARGAALPACRSG